MRTIKASTWRLLLFLGGFAVFFLLRDFSVGGGDTPALLDPTDAKYLPRWSEYLSYNVREPLAHIIVQKTYHAIGDLPLAFALVSSLCGGLWLVMLSLFNRSAAFWVVNLCSVLVMVFVGHKEYYAPVVVALTIYFFLLLRASQSESRVKPWHCLAAFALAVHMHKLAIFYLPGAAFLFFDFQTRTIRPWPRRQIEYALIVVIVTVVLLQVPMWLQAFYVLDWMVVMDYDNRILELVTLPAGWADRVAQRSVTGAYQIFYFGELKHFLYYFGFLAAGAPLGLPILVRKWRAALSPELQAFLCCAVCSLIWTFFWHPHMGWCDWDLFCTAAVPINILAGWIVSRPLTDVVAQPRPPDSSGNSQG